MVDDFLDLARLEGTAIRIDPTPVDLCALVRASVSDFEHVAAAKGVRIAMEPCESAVVGGDRRRLQQVVTNLLSNALKFSNDGGTVMVRITRREGVLETEVEDSGRGIAQEVLPTLFQRYSRALDTAHKVAGTGLGLMIVREIVEAHRGTVDVRSTPHVGSTFTFRLPAG